MMTSTFSVCRICVRRGAQAIATVLLFVSATAILAQSDRVVITPSPGYVITWDGNNGAFSSGEPGVTAPDNAALASQGTVPFGSSAFMPGGIHDFVNVNDGFYGNSSSWIADFAAPDPDPSVGVSFGRTVPIRSIAWSRDNGDDAERTPPGPYVDRAVGVYTLQITRVENPDSSTPESDNPADGWVTIGTVEYQSGADTPIFSAYLRHRFEVSTADNDPISATGFRIKVSDPNICIDEIEVNPPADPSPPISTLIAISSSPGYEIAWSGNEGGFSVPDSPAPVPENRASPSRGTTAFGSSEFGSGIHLIAHVIDGLYGNAHSWIAKFTDPPDPAPYIGLNFGELIELTNIAWGRDNGDDAERTPAGPYTDRAIGTYTLQITRAANPGTGTPESGDPETGWVTIGTVEYKGESDVFRPYLRHSYTVTQEGAPISATGLRIKVSDPNLAIDEIEVNVSSALQALVDGLVVLNSESGFQITWDGNDGEFFSPNPGAAAPENEALAANGAKAFGSGQLFEEGSIHDIDNVIDGLYGNSNSWIPGAQAVDPNVDPASEPFIGVNFGKTVPITSIAWGRDNGNNPGDCCGGQLQDRWEGIYTVQVTRVPDPSAATFETGDAATGWATVATVEYTGQAAPDFNPWLRHRFGLTQDGNPISATGVRIKVSNGGTCIDEIEINPSGVPRPAVLIENGPGFTIQWNGNNGRFSTPDSPARAPQNAALASNGTAAFGSSEFGADVHRIVHINDGLYGNSKSWIANFSDPPDPDPFIGLNFGRVIPIRNIAWSRDNGDVAGDCCGGELTDRAVGVYTIQVTTSPNPGVGTPDTGDPATGWATVGTVEYTGEEDARFDPHLRHRFDVSSGGNPISASGLRIKVSDPSIAIDEIEVNVSLADEGEVLEIVSQNGYSLRWDGNDGDFFDPAEGAAAPDNLALASKGVVAFGTTEFDAGGIHLIANVNDGLYGNSHSWIADFGIPDPEPFVGLSFGESISIGAIAWGRDNGNNETDCCGGELTDRWSGVYTLQITTMPDPGVETPEAETADPSAGWVTIGTVQYKIPAPPEFRPWLRHQFEVSRDGQPIQATGLRFKTSDVQICIDEIEVYPQTVPSDPPRLSITVQGANLVISWEGGGALQAADVVTGPWAPVEGASSPYTATATSDARFFRVQR